MGFTSALVVKNLPAVQEMEVQSLGQEDPLEKEMATHSSIFAWEIPRTEEPGGLQSMGSQRVGHNLATKQQQDPVQPKTNTVSGLLLPESHQAHLPGVGPVAQRSPD